MILATVKRGDTWNFIFNWKSGNTPIDLTDCTARMQVRKKKLGTLLASVTTEDGGITITAEDGKVSVSFPASATDACEPGTHSTDLEITFTSTGEVRSSETMDLVVLEDISR